MTPFPGPVTLRSRPIRSAHVAYTEVEGHAVLCQLDDALVHEVDGAGVALWAALDGRSLQELADASGDPDRSAGEIIEAVRRLRALGLVDELMDELVDEPVDASVAEAAPVAAAPHAAAPLDLAGTPAPSVELQGTAVAADGLIALHLQPSATASVSVRMDGAPHVTGAGAVAAIVATPGDDPQGPRSPGDLPPVDALRVLVAATVPRSLHEPNAVDALAVLVERVPVTCSPAPHGAAPPP